MENEDLNYLYRFNFTTANNLARVIEYCVEVDTHDKILKHKNLNLNTSQQSACALSNHKCPNCPLTESESASCPAALSIMKIINQFNELNSYEKCSVSVISQNRTYQKDCDIQKGLQSLIGLSLAFSGCPHTRFLSVMGKYHLPFSDTKETIVRVLSFYLLECYADGKIVDKNLQGLRDRYEQLSIINRYLLKRISDIELKDASKNALVILDTFSEMFKIEYDLNFEDIKDYL